MTGLLVFLIALLVPAVASAQTVLVPAGSVWRYLDNGSNQGTAWRAPAFNDGAWASGPAQLGYGDGGEATVVGYGPNASNKYITTYFRRSFNVVDRSAFSGLTLRLLRDDGAVVYLNGVEIVRSNMPSGTIAYRTLASTAISGTGESTFVSATLGIGALVNGTNVLAVEVHQSGATSSDLSFDLELIGTTSALAVTRGPYLQMGSPTDVVVRWRTNQPSASRVRYGPDPATLTGVVDLPASTTEHEVRVSGLAPDTRYYYAIGTPTATLAGGDLTHFFVTSPVRGTPKPTRVWVIGDSGTADANARAVRDAYLAYTGSRHTDLWLMLGDNAYEDGTDAEYQAAVFDMYPTLLRKSVLWPTYGNHDGQAANSSTQTGPYYDIFSLPTQAQAGGIPTGTEAYYSFDYGNIHFISLESFETDRSSAGPMMTWLRNDLAATTQPWIVAFWHHPPYSKGAHNSDVDVESVQMRQTALPILEAAGVDLVLTGHSHSYERSFLLDGHYGGSTTLTPAMILDGGNGRESGSGAYQKPAAVKVPHEGAVYAVAGSSGETAGGPLNHPAMFISLNTLGSMVLDINGGRLDAVFLDSTGVVRDSFTIVKSTIDVTPPVRSNGQPAGVLPAGTTGAPISLVTDEAATCRYATAAGVAYGAMTTTFTATGGTSHSVVINGLVDGSNYSFFVRCQDLAGNPNTSDFAIAFSVAQPTDTTPPVRSSGAPSGTLAAGTSQASLSLATNENATCRYATTAGVAYTAMPSAFSATGGTAHSTSVSGLTNGGSYSFFVRCQDLAGNPNTSDFAIAFSVAQPTDTTPPVRSSGAPSGALAAGTTQASLSLATNENATCRYATTAGVVYTAMPSTFSTTGGTTHSTTVGGLANGGSYSFFVRCQDGAANANPDDFAIAFSVAQPTDTTPPVRSSGAPTGTLAAGTTQASLSLATNENATCRYATTAGVAYGAMPSAFSTTGGTAHSTTVGGLANGGSYSFFVRCQDVAGNANTNDFTIAFSVAPVTTAGLVAAFGFNEGSGNSTADATGNGHTGAVSGAAWTTQGRFGNALAFDGVNDWVTVNSTALLALSTGMTLEAWVFPTAHSPNWNNVIIKERPNGEVYNLYSNIDTSVPTVYVVRATAPTTPLDARGTSQLPLNVWTHLAATYDGTTLRLFVNGAQVGSRALTGALVTSTGALRVGGNGIWGEFFQGRIDEIRIYNRALSPVEIQADMAAPIAP